MRGSSDKRGAATFSGADLSLNGTSVPAAGQRAARLASPRANDRDLAYIVSMAGDLRATAKPASHGGSISPAGDDVAYIVENSEASAFIVQHDWWSGWAPSGTAWESPDRYVHFGAGDRRPGYVAYQGLSPRGIDRAAGLGCAEDTWVFIYTRHHRPPKGAMRSHGARRSTLWRHWQTWSSAARRRPAGHADVPCELAVLASAFTAAAAGCASTTPRLEPSTCWDAGGAAHDLTRWSTHYIMMLALPERCGRIRRRQRHPAADLVGSRPPGHQARHHGSSVIRGCRDVMAPASGLVTLLRPEEQMTRLGSIGRELIGSGPIRALDENARGGGGRGRRTSFAHALVLEGY